MSVGHSVKRHLRQKYVDAIYDNRTDLNTRKNAWGHTTSLYCTMYCIVYIYIYRSRDGKRLGSMVKRYFIWRIQLRPFRFRILLADVFQYDLIWCYNLLNLSSMDSLWKIACLSLYVRVCQNVHSLDKIRPHGEFTTPFDIYIYIYISDDRTESYSIVKRVRVSIHRRTSAYIYIYCCT